MPSELDPLLRQALAWVIRLHSGAATSGDAAALALWRQRGPEHEAAFRDAAGLWRSFGDAARSLVGEADLAHVGRAEPRAPRTLYSRRALIGGAMAAAASLAGGYLIVRPPLGLWPSFEELTADYRTAKGERRNVALSDGISLTLNTQTSIAVRSTREKPRIELISGETAVQAAGTAAPLVVDAAGGRITAGQASFNVKFLDGAVSVSCIDGTVEVEWSEQRVSLSEAQQLAYSAEAGLGSASPADLEQARAWRNGLLIVRDWPVDRLVDEINRYRPGRIVLTDSQLGRRMISGTFHLDHLDDFIAQARGLFGANARSLPGGIVLLG
jgi:transmembrane sensor